MVKPSCCEVCDRNPTCGNDCGSCFPVEAPEGFQEALTALIGTVPPVDVEVRRRAKREEK